MKYLILFHRPYAAGYEIREFATKEELSAHLLNTDTLARDIIVAERLSVSIQLGEYVPPVEEPAEAEETEPPIVAEAP